MNPIIKNLLAVVAGVVVGMIVNMSLIKLGMKIIPPPEGVDVLDPQSMKEGIHLFTPKNFLFPFLAHALGTLFGAFITVRLAATHHMKLALGIGLWFLFGGFVMVLMVPGPTWFSALDLLGAYFPMAFLGGKIAGGNRPTPPTVNPNILDS